MKRFFQPVQKDASFKKPTLSSVKDSEEISLSHSDEDSKCSTAKLPLKFLTWNANSLLLRIKSNLADLSKFLLNVDPDVIAIQEVRIPAAGCKGASKNQAELKDDTTSSREEKQVLMRALLNPPFKNYNIWWSLSDSKYAGTALLIKKCFQPKRISFTLDQTGSKHEQDGRVILAEFESFRLLNTYVPNNGWKEEESSFQRRRKWDKRMLEFVLRTSDKPLIWCGDLNVSHQDIDVSHPEFFSTAKLNGYVPPNSEDCGQPGFTLSERKRFGSILKDIYSLVLPAKLVDETPGSALGLEHWILIRSYMMLYSMAIFHLILALNESDTTENWGKLVDAYRYLHKENDMERGFSWSGNPIGKYRGKRMRIDYFIVSEKLSDRIVSCEMHGQGIELEGFYGSDHCPVSLELSDPDATQLLPETGVS